VPRRAAVAAPRNEPRRAGGRSLEWAIAWTLLVGIAAAEVIGATARPDWWGVNAYRFLDPAVLWIACGLLAAIAWLVWRWPAAIERAFSGRAAAGPEPARGPADSKPAWPWLVALGAASFVLFWTCREAHTLLGDGHPLTRNLPLGQQFHPDEPLALYLHHGFYLLTRGLFARPGRDPAEVARDTVALSSALAGALFVPIAWALAREIVARGHRSVRTEADGANGTRVMLFLALIGQGYIQLFFGYVENYTLYCLVIAAFALAALRMIDGQAPIVLAGALVVAAAALHLAGALLVPALGVLVVHEWLRPERRRALIRDLALGLALFIATHFALGLLQPHYSWLAMLARLAGSVTNSGSSYGFQRPGARDFLNQQLLIGPLGALLFVPAAVVSVMAGSARNWKGTFLLALGIAFLAASVIAGDSNLGVARNWDLLAPAGFVLTLSGLGLALGAGFTPRDRHRWLVLLAAVSLFHTVPWIANNASFDRAFARFKLLPLGLGRTQAVVGNLYLERGQVDSASVWFRRALEENPANNLASFELGRIAMSRGDYDEASRAFQAASAARPATESYRYLLASALVHSGKAGEARPEMDWLLQAHPDQPIYWAASSVIWQCQGERDSSLAALGVADRLAPGDSLLVALRAHLGRRDGLPAAIEAVWPQITLP
jgi:tetratricopeptide (TPR) repeat protein